MGGELWNAYVGFETPRCHNPLRVLQLAGDYASNVVERFVLKRLVSCGTLWFYNPQGVVEPKRCGTPQGLWNGSVVEPLRVMKRKRCTAPLES